MNAIWSLFRITRSDLAMDEAASFKENETVMSEVRLRGLEVPSVAVNK